MGPSQPVVPSSALIIYGLGLRERLGDTYWGRLEEEVSIYGAMEKLPCTLRTDFPCAWLNQPSLIGLYMSLINPLVALDGI